MMHHKEKSDPHHLGGAAESETPDICGNQIDPGVGYRNVAGVSIHQALVIHLGDTHMSVSLQSSYIQHLRPRELLLLALI